jgi:hypothetical protein
MADRPSYVYVTYIDASPERVWQALTDAGLTAAYWGHSNVSDWQAGSRWEHRRADGSGIADTIGTGQRRAPWPTGRAAKSSATTASWPASPANTAASAGGVAGTAVSRPCG